MSEDVRDNEGGLLSRNWVEKILARAEAAYLSKLAQDHDKYIKSIESDEDLHISRYIDRSKGRDIYRLWKKIEKENKEGKNYKTILNIDGKLWLGWRIVEI